MLIPDAIRPRAPRALERGAWLALWLAALAPALALPACGDDDGDLPDAGEHGGDGDGGDGGDGGTGPDDAGDDAGPPTFGGLTIDTSPEEQALDLFGQPGHRLWLEVSTDQLFLLNADQAGAPGGDEDIYVPGVPGSDAMYGDHLVIQDVVSESVADYGKVEIALVGESTGRSWDKRRIPNIRIDANEFDKEKRVGTFEHMRLNNALVGSIFREGLAHTIYRELGYPALRSSFVFLGSNVWGDTVWVPMVLMEMYKKRFCRDNEALLGATCENMWEFPGDLGEGGGGFPGPGIPLPIDIIDAPRPRPRPDDGEVTVPPEWCQISRCDDTRLIATMEALRGAPEGAGFKAALDPYIEWSRYHEFQCLSWILWTGDDPIHNSNNNLIIERVSDGKLIWAPYSVDISAGQSWYLNTPLPGTGAVARGCQQDPECWADTVATCEDLIVRFDELNPEELVDDLVTLLTDLDMMRYGDDARAEELRAWFVWRQTSLSSELERYRFLPDGEGRCPDGMEVCNDATCGTPEQCEERQCPLGQLACPSTGQCYDPAWDRCPECPGSAPLYCTFTGECIADLQICADACNASPEWQWCSSQRDCVPIGSCFGGDGDGEGEDGGIIPF